MRDWRTYIYLNNGATSWPKPDCVADAMAQAVKNLPGEGNRGGLQDFDVFGEVRRDLAACMEISHPEQIALGCNATWALNLGIFGFPLQPGDTILATLAEHNAVLRPLHRLQQKGVRVYYADTDPQGRILPEVWEKAVREYHPSLCIFTHASNVTGAVQDAKVLTEMGKKNGAAVLLDMSQTLGWVPVELETWGVDMAAFTGHKYLLGPQGTGGLYVRPGIKLQPYLLGGTGIRSDLLEMPEEMPVHLEAGTGNEPAYHGLLAALRWSRENPVDRAKTELQAERLKEGLCTMGCQVISPEGATTPVVSFRIPGMSVLEAGEILRDSYDVIARAGLHCAPALMKAFGFEEGTLRLSLSRFTTDQEIDAVLEAVRDLVEGVYGI